MQHSIIFSFPSSHSIQISTSEEAINHSHKTLGFRSSAKSASMTCNLVLRFINSALSAAMGCLFGRFRVISERCPPRTHLVSEPAGSRSRRNIASPNQFTSLLVSEDFEEDDDSLCKEKLNRSSGFQQPEITDRDLQDEAKFLKACGILVETPAEFRKTKEKLQYSEEQDSDNGSPKFHSWYPDTSVEKLCFNKEGQPLSLKPSKHCGYCEDEESSSEHSTDSCVAETCNKGNSPAGHKKSQSASLASPNKIQDNDMYNSSGLNSPRLRSAALKSRATSVDFAREPETPLLSSSNSLSDKVEQSHCKVEMPGYHVDFKYSPDPTPLQLTDEMQTPGSIYPVDLKRASKGRNARIRSQYVYADLNPDENISHWRILKQEEAGGGEMEKTNNDPVQLPDSVIESSEHLDDTPGHCADKENKYLADKYLKVEASLSAWLRPPPSASDKKIESHEVLGTQKLGLTPGSRHNFGVIPASYWNRDGSSDMSHKGWDGNGIPNTTTKYKEDQKVKWHATPFEERLEKALPADSSIPERCRRLMDEKPIVYEDKEDEGTESPLQSSTLPHGSESPIGRAPH